ncbi:hypothetical protein SCH4B_0062 [Ruegeria sp. TrichCH4B]|nr:hypothetical protein SCH4B_0062 [Ruegeria sp. TrichCH4B]
MMETECPHLASAMVATKLSQEGFSLEASSHFTTYARAH